MVEGSIVKLDPELKEVTIDGESVGFELAKRAQCFGGETLTVTDVAVKAGICQSPGADPVSEAETERIVPHCAPSCRTR